MKTKLYLLALMLLLAISPILNAQHNYGEVLQKSMFFYEVQQAGPLSENNRVAWRADAAMEDGSDVGVNLTGGWFDAGDHVKFNFPMAYSVTTLCWGYLENKDAYTSLSQTEKFLENIKHATDYLLRCHTAPNELYAQVGDGDEDHKYWVPAEVISIRSDRPSFKIDAANPGSDLAGETAAALAAASLVFKDNNPSYSATLLEHAEQLYSFADNYRGVYSDVIPVGDFYKSWSGYQDELVWGAIWMYKATNQASYLDKAKTEYTLLSNEEREEVKSYGWTLAWDDKAYGCYVLMATLTGEESYNADAERFLDTWFESRAGSKGPDFTSAGFPILDSWGSFRYAANTAFLLMEQSDNISDVAKRDAYRARAKEIVDYLLGDNPQNTSYVIGYGDKYPLYPHHRTAHGSWNRDESVPVETRHILYGALVGGHKNPSDTDWTDDRHDYYWNEVACDYNSLWTGVVARLYNEYGGTAIPNFPADETPLGEFFVEAKMNSEGSTHSEYAVWAHNRTAWPARIPSFKFRIFVDISEGVEAGYSISDYIVSGNSNSADYTELLPADAANGIYYTEVTFKSDVVIYPGGQGESKEEAQIRIRLPYDAPASAWDPTNDWSYQGVGEDLAEAKYIPLYADGELAFGEEAGPVEDVDVTGISVSPEELTINKGQTGSLTATVSPPNATNKSAVWASNNTNVATVNQSGVVSGVAEGEAIISATSVDGDFVANCTVTVTDIVLPTYTLTVNSGANGNVTVSPDEDEYTEGDEVSLTAIANSGYRFDSWGGDLSGTNATASIVMDSDKTVTATFVESASGCSNPQVIELPYELDGVNEVCLQTSGTIDYINTWNADEVTINGVDITNDYTGTMPPREDGKYNIYFKSSVSWAHIEIIGSGGSVTEYNLTSTVVGSGTISPANGTYTENAVVELTATPASGWQFDGWTGDASGTSATTSVTMISDKNVTATFSEIPAPEEYTLTAQTIGSGTVTPAGGTYTENSVVELTATPVAGWQFDGWSGDASGTSVTTSVTMTSDKSITATFSEIPEPVYYTLTVQTSENGTVTPGSGDYLEGSEVTLTATPDAGNKFDTWSGDASGVDASTTIVMDGNKSVTATFVIDDNSSCFDDEPMATALPSMQEEYQHIHIIGDGPALGNVTKFTINWDLANNGLWQFSMNTNNNQPGWYVNLLPSVNHTLNSAQPSISISESGFDGLDGDYWAVLDGENFALVDKQGAYSIYFSKSADSPCLKSAPGFLNENALSADILVYPNPASDVITITNLDGVNKIQILNTLGQTVYQKEAGIYEMETISIEHLDKGTYILMTFSSKGVPQTQVFSIK